MIGDSVWTYVIAVLGVAVLFITRAPVIVPLYATSALSLFISFRIILPEQENFLLEFPAFFGLLIMGVLISQLMYHLYVNQFVAKKRLSHIKDQLAEKNVQLEKKNKELERTQLHLIQQEKLATIGQLAAGIAHEINNPLSFIKSNVSTLRQRLKSIKPVLFSHVSENSNQPDISEDTHNVIPDMVEELDEIIEDTQQGIKRVTGVVHNLLDFSRDEVSNRFESYDLHNGIESTLNIAANELKYVEEIRKHYGELPLIKCKGGEINQVLLNLFTNAAHALKEGTAAPGRKSIITITTREENETVVCDVWNNGPPIPKEQWDRIFEPFFTTKSAGRGTGLGLSITRNIIVNRHNGNLTLIHSDDEGTTFRIRLPIEQPSQA
jgi:signal transduction histidine kinase